MDWYGKPEDMNQAHRPSVQSIISVRDADGNVTVLNGVIIETLTEYTSKEKQSVAGGVISRLVMFVHALLVIILCLQTKTNKAYSDYRWFAISGLVPFLAESIYTIVRRKGEEWKWFTPCVFFYLLAAVPPLWIFEYDRYWNSVAKQEVAFICSNSSIVTLQEVFTGFVKGSLKEQTDYWKYYKMCGDGITLIQQSVLLVTIMGRWMLPRPRGSNGNQKSAMLLVTIAVASDILELFDAMEEDKVGGNLMLVGVILTLWSGSLLQFSFVLTANREKLASQWYLKIFETEIWAIVTCLLLNDVPFMTLRIALIVSYSVTSYGHLFFTAKNVIVISLNLYRIYILTKPYRSGPTPSEEPDQNSRLSISLDLGTGRRSSQFDFDGTPRSDQLVVASRFDTIVEESTYFNKNAEESSNGDLNGNTQDSTPSTSSIPLPGAFNPCGHGNSTSMASTPTGSSDSLTGASSRRRFSDSDSVGNDSSVGAGTKDTTL